MGRGIYPSTGLPCIFLILLAITGLVWQKSEVAKGGNESRLILTNVSRKVLGSLTTSTAN